MNSKVNIFHIFLETSFINYLWILKINVYILRIFCWNVLKILSINEEPMVRKIMRRSQAESFPSNRNKILITHFRFTFPSELVPQNATWAIERHIFIKNKNNFALHFNLTKKDCYENPYHNTKNFRKIFRFILMTIDSTFEKFKMSHQLKKKFNYEKQYYLLRGWKKLGRFTRHAYDNVHRTDFKADCAWIEGSLAGELAKSKCVTAIRCPHLMSRINIKKKEKNGAMLPHEHIMNAQFHDDYDVSLFLVSHLDRFTYSFSLSLKSISYSKSALSKNSNETLCTIRNWRLNLIQWNGFGFS